MITITMVAGLVKRVKRLIDRVKKLVEQVKKHEKQIKEIVAVLKMLRKHYPDLFKG